MNQAVASMIQYVAGFSVHQFVEAAQSPISSGYQ